MAYKFKDIIKVKNINIEELNGKTKRFITRYEDLDKKEEKTKSDVTALEDINEAIVVDLMAYLVERDDKARLEAEAEEKAKLENQEEYIPAWKRLNNRMLGRQ